MSFLMSRVVYDIEILDFIKFFRELKIVIQFEKFFKK